MQSLPKWRRAEEEYLPLRVRWELQGIPISRKVGETLYERGVMDLPSSLVPALGKGGLKEILESEDPAVLLPAFAAARLFGRELPRWLAATGQTLHDAGQSCQLVPLSEVNNAEVRRAWMRLVWATKGPDCALNLATSWGEVREANNGKVPTTLSELTRIAAKVQYGVITPEWERLTETCARLKLSRQQFEQYREFLGGRSCAAEKTVPEVRVLGSDVGLPGEWVLQRIDSDDPIGPMLGLATNCCQHLKGAASSCAKRIWDHADASAWVITYRGEIIAQSYVWRHNETLTVDSIEALSSAYVEGIALLYQAAGREVLGKLGVARVLVGSTSYGITRKISAQLQLPYWGAPKGCPSNYTDAKDAYLLAGAA